LECLVSDDHLIGAHIEQDNVSAIKKRKK